VRRDWPDVWGGLILIAIGIGAAVWAGLHYDLGTLRRMGPGFFPVTLGSALAVFGLVIALPALWRPGAAIRFDTAPLLYVLAAIVVFGLALPRLGLVLTTLACVLIATLPAPRPGWLWRGVLTLAVTALTVAVFHLGLRMSVPLWPRF
jgi:hypothetical protein